MEQDAGLDEQLSKAALVVWLRTSLIRVRYVPQSKNCSVGKQMYGNGSNKVSRSKGILY